MKEFIEIILSFDIKRIFYAPTQNSLVQFFRYGFVGGIATVADWGALYILKEFMNVHYMVSAVVAFIVGLTVNFLLSKKFVFSGEKNNNSSSTEFVVYAIIGVIGLIMTEIIMWFLHGVLGWYFMIPKVIATAVVFVWNFAARKIFLYR